jgi:hypothetical protein
MRGVCAAHIFKGSVGEEGARGRRGKKVFPSLFLSFVPKSAAWRGGGEVKER